jgi:hypothetical protein
VTTIPPTENEFNVLVYSTDTTIVKTLRKVCQMLQLPLVEADKAADLLEYTYRIGFVDLALFDEILDAGLNELSKEEKGRKWEVVILGGRPVSVPMPLSLFCKSLTDYTVDGFADIITRHLSMVRIHKERDIKSRVHRIVALVDLLNDHYGLDKKEICKEFGITERTLFRDLKLIKEVFPDTYYFFTSDKD